MLNDNGPKVVVCLWTMTAVAFLFMNLRFFCKGVYTRQLRIDDAILLVSWIFTLLYAALITVSVHYGMGKRAVDLDPNNVVPMNKYLFLGEFFTLMAIPVSKTSFTVTLLRITTRKWQKCFIWFVIISVNIVYWLCGILLLVQCHPVAKNWNTTMPGKCWKSKIQDDYSIFAGAYSAFLDFVLATFPCAIIYKLQMSRREKTGVIVAMSLGFLAGITACVKTSTLPGVGKFKDPTFQLADLLIWSNAEVAVTIIAASIPFFRVLLKHVTSSYGNSKPHPYRQSYRLESVGKVHTIGTGKRSRGVREIDIHRDDDLSDKSILGDGMVVGAMGAGGAGTIVKSSEVTIEYDDDKSGISPVHKV